MLIKIITFLLLIIFLSIQLTGQSKADNKIEIIPKSADISVSNIYLHNSKTSEEVLGKEIVLNAEADLPYVHYYNKDKTQILTLIFHPGNIKNSFSELNVKKSNPEREKDIHTLKNIKYFVTGKNIKLGIKKNELIKILGEEFTSEVKNGVLMIRYKIDDFKNSEFLKAYNMPIYYGEYKFKNNKLIEFSFGFEYP